MENCRNIMGSFSQHAFCLFCSQSVQEERKHEGILALKYKKNKSGFRSLADFIDGESSRSQRDRLLDVIITKGMLQTPQKEREKGENIYLASLWYWMCDVGKRYTSPLQLTSSWTGLLCLNAKRMFTRQNNSIYGKERTMNISLAVKCLLNDGALL